MANRSDGQEYFNGTVEFNGRTSFSNNVTFDGNATFNGTVQGAGGLTYKGTWDANANNPSLPTGSEENGDYYIVSTAGTTNLDGITDWGVSDWAIYNGSAYQKIDNSEPATLSKGSLCSSPYGNATLSSTVIAPLGVMPINYTITAIRISYRFGSNNSDTNYWTFKVENAGALGDDTPVLLTESGDANTNKIGFLDVSGNNRSCDLVLTSTTANLDGNAGDTLLLTMTETGTATFILTNVNVEYIAR